MKVLAVDDKEENLYLLEAVLKNINCEVESVSNGIEALEKLYSESYDLIISDILMPEMDGFQLCKKVKTDDRLKNIPFIFYTATYTDKKDEQLALKLGVAGFIRKPVEPDKFLKIIKDIMKNTNEVKIKKLKSVADEDKEILKMYSERLVRKLEKKMLDLEESEKKLEKLNRILEKKVKEKTIQLQNTVKELEAFSYSVSHDLRAPLRAINGFSKVLLEDYESKLDNKGRELLHIIYNNSQNMSQMIVDILTFFKLSIRDITRSEIDMNLLVKKTITEIRFCQDIKKTEFGLKDLAIAYGDFSMIRIVWMNLISNSIKFSKSRENPVIEIGSYKEKEDDVYFVKDNGVGFDMKYKNKIFEIFHRLSSSVEFEGTGIGLSVVKRIIEKHGGRIWCEGEVDKGAAFYFTLPFKEKAGKSQRAKVKSGN